MLPTRPVEQFISVGAVLLVGLAVASAQVARRDVRVVIPSEIEYKPVSGYPSGYARAMLEGETDKAMSITYRVRLPPHFKFEPHTHEWDEHVTVLEGTWYLGFGTSFEKSRLKALPPMSFVIIPSGTPHFVYTEGEVVCQVHGTGPVGLTFVRKPEGPQ
jgi:quercetin dioxygenase-like cupin family protein